MATVLVNADIGHFPHWGKSIGRQWWKTGNYFSCGTTKAERREKTVTCLNPAVRNRRTPRFLTRNPKRKLPNVYKGEPRENGVLDRGSRYSVFMLVHTSLRTCWLSISKAEGEVTRTAGQSSSETARAEWAGCREQVEVSSRLRLWAAHVCWRVTALVLFGAGEPGGFKAE